MEEQIFPSPAVAGLLSSGYIEARIHNDHAEKGEEQRKFQAEMVGYVAAPHYVIIDPATGQKLGEHKLESVGDGFDAIRDKFAAFLRNKGQGE